MRNPFAALYMDHPVHANGTLMCVISSTNWKECFSSDLQVFPIMLIIDLLSVCNLVENSKSIILTMKKGLMTPGEPIEHLAGANKYVSCLINEH